MHKDSHKDLEKIRQLFLTGDREQINLGLLLAASNHVDLSPMELGLKAIFKEAKLQPRLGDWQNATMEQLLAPLGMVLALSIEQVYLPELAREIGLFRRVGIVELHNIYLHELPEDIGFLRNLRSLSLKQNRLSSLPESLGKLSKLKSLLLADNQLTTLPDSLQDLAALEVLDLAQNPNLTQIPRWITALPSLKRLILDPQVFEYKIPETLRPFPTTIQLDWQSIAPKV